MARDMGLTALTAMFALFLVQTWRRQHVRVLLWPSGLALVDRAQRRLTWDQLERLRLRWFGSRRQGKGWLELELAGNGQRLVLSSALEGFDRVVAAAVAAARANDVALEPATSANIEALLGHGPTRVARASAVLPVVRRFAGNRDIVNVAFAQPACDTRRNRQPVCMARRSPLPV